MNLLSTIILKTNYHILLSNNEIEHTFFLSHTSISMQLLFFQAFFFLLHRPTIINLCTSLLLTNVLKQFELHASFVMT